MKKIHFVIDLEKEYEYHKLFKSSDEFERMSLFEFLPIDDKERILRKINSFWDDKDKKVVQNMETAWRSVEADYFRLVEDITGVPWLYDDYYAYILAFSKVMGFSNPLDLKSKEIALTLGASVNPKFLVGHELFHSHYYYVADKFGLTDKNCTLYTEGVAALALSQSPLKELFKETNFESSISGYPKVEENWDKLVKLWNERQSFESFLRKAMEEIR